MSGLLLEQHLVVARAQLGDEQAFQWLVHHYTPRLLWFVRKIGLSPVNADDVVQNVWLAAWSSLHRLRKVDRFRSWLYGIARNKALQYVAQVREVPIANFESVPDAPDDSFFERYMPHLNEALDRLSVIHREILALRFLEEMTFEELSEATGTSVGTIKSRLHNAKVALREKLEVIVDD